MGYPNWFAITAEKNFAKHLAPHKGNKVRYLQIGAFAGHATQWLQRNVLTHEDSLLYDVDTWEGSDEAVHKEFDWDHVYHTYLNIAGPKTLPFRMTSDEFFKDNSTIFNFIYVDGDHTAYQVERDLENAHKFTKKGSIIAMDDYTWGQGLPMHLRPKPAIDEFLFRHSDEYDVIERGAQLWVKKS